MTHTVCPLCSQANGVPIRSIPFSSIWRQLEVQHRARFSPSLIEQLAPAQSTVLLLCRNCRLQYFSPAKAGNSEFYRQLTTADPKYYNSETWDFHCAISCIPVGSAVLDVACGAGAFLSFAQRQGLQAQGIDTNPAAISKARATGSRADLIDLESFSSHHEGCFDVVTAFQVLEHLDSVVPFTKQAAACLRPGGRLLVSVPNRHRLWRQPDEPLDCPPHHLSRWSHYQFEQLAQRSGLILHSVYFEPASLVDLLPPSLKRHRPLLKESVVAGPMRQWPPASLRRVAAPLRRPSKIMALLGFRRMSMLAELVAPSRS